MITPQQMKDILSGFITPDKIFIQPENDKQNNGEQVAMLSKAEVPKYISETVSKCVELIVHDVVENADQFLTLCIIRDEICQHWDNNAVGAQRLAEKNNHQAKMLGDYIAQSAMTHYPHKS